MALLQGPTGSSKAIEIYKKVAGSSTEIGPTVKLTLQVGDVVQLAATGSSPVLISLYQNNFLVEQVEDWSNQFTSGVRAS